MARRHGPGFPRALGRGGGVRGNPAPAGRRPSRQSRVAKMEAADPLVSIDLLVRTLLALGVSRREIAGLIGGPASSHKAA